MHGLIEIRGAVAAITKIVSLLLNTAYVDPEQLNQYTAAGFAGVIARPAGKPELLDEIRKHS